MNPLIRAFLTASVVSLGALLAWSSHAQSANDHQHHHGTAQPSFSDGEVRRVDAENGKVTIKHGEIPHLDMPGMTMVFTVKDKALLQGVAVGDQVRFVVVSESGKLVITELLK